MTIVFGVNGSGGGSASPETIRAQALQAESLGFDSFVWADHIVIPKQSQSLYPYAPDRISTFRSDVPFFEPLSTMLYLAGCTERIRLGVNVLIVPYRPPVLAAKMLTMLDVLSGGRLVFGAGVGWMAEEFQALGLDTFQDRGDVTDEYLQAFKALWTQDEPRFEGRFCKVSEIGFLPKPIQKPHPPIWIGGHTDRALRRAAMYGDGWQPLGTFPPAVFWPDDLRPKILRLRELTRAAGRDEDAVGICFGGAVRFDDAAGEDRLPLQGSVEQVISDIQAYEEIGVDRFILYFSWGRGGEASTFADDITRFAQEVMPLFA